MPFRSVSKATIAFGEEFLYELKAALGRNDTAATGDGPHPLRT
jgi:hypothetical protein